MKILHTSDWHLGRQFYGQSLEEAHKACLDQVLQAIKTHHPNVLIVAGDIFDRAAPPASAVRLYNDFMARVYSETETAIIVIAGNHDSGDRVAANSAMVDQNRVLIRGPVANDEPPFMVQDDYGPVAFSALPFAGEFAARDCFENTEITSPADVMAAQMQVARQHIEPGTRWVVIAHAYVSTALTSESERPLLIGGVETVPPESFTGVDYVALGHLHRPQGLEGGRLRYSGAPLAFGFDEGEGQKSMALVELDGKGIASTQLLPFLPLQKVRKVRGAFADILEQGRQSPSDDFLKIELTDRDALIDPMGQLRQVFPCAMVLEYVRDQEVKEHDVHTHASRSLDAPEDVVSDFLTYVRDEPPSDDDKAFIQATFNRLTQQGD